jgi:hypothetical protein
MRLSRSAFIVAVPFAILAAAGAWGGESRNKHQRGAGGQGREETRSRSPQGFCRLTKKLSQF